MRWLLDANVRQQAIGVLAEFGVDAGHSTRRGWGHLKNGEFVEAAVAAGFDCVLTRDRQFAESATKALRRFPAFSVVLLGFPQLRKEAFVLALRAALVADPLHPEPGSMQVWPTSVAPQNLSPSLS
jgi:predicted nuclease of predicted toxin-antitoxin system